MATEKSIIVWSKEGCSYCNEVKGYLTEQNIPFKTVDVTNHDEFRDILETKYGVRHVPVVEIGDGHTYAGVTTVGLDHLKEALGKAVV